MGGSKFLKDVGIDLNPTPQIYFYEPVPADLYGFEY